MSVFFVVVVTVVTDEFQEDSCKEHEYKSLNQANKKLQEIERHGRKPCEVGRNRVHHRLENILTSEDVSIEAESKSDGAHQDGDNLQKADREKDDRHEDSHDSSKLALRCKNVGKEAFNTIFAHGPVDPEESEGDGHAACHVKVGVGSTEEWGVVTVVDTTDGSHSGNETRPVTDEDHQENSGEEPESALAEIFSKNPLKESVKALNDPLSEVLEAGWNEFHLLGRCAAENNDDDCREPDHQHGVGDGQTIDDFLGVERQGVCLLTRKCHTGQKEKKGWNKRAH